MSAGRSREGPLDANADNLTRQFEVTRFTSGTRGESRDIVAAEEPLGIWLHYWFKDTQVSHSLAVTMRTPGNDREVAAGYLLGEGIIRNQSDIVEIRPMGGTDSNEISIELTRSVDVEGWRVARSSFVGASCGICGKRTREAVSLEVKSLSGNRLCIRAASIYGLSERLRKRQAGFSQTGGLHAAALVNADGQIESVFEDIGRHNALDKLAGSCVLSGRIPLKDHLIFLSSRSSFELVQKTAMAGAPILATVGAPSSLAIEAARDFGVTLLGFVGPSRFNAYSGEWRIRTDMGGVEGREV